MVAAFGEAASVPASFGPPLEVPPDVDPLLVPDDPLVPEELALGGRSPLEPLEPGTVPDDPSPSDVPGSAPSCVLPGGPKSSVLLAPLHATTARRSEEGAISKRSFIDDSRGESPT